MPAQPSSALSIPKHPSASANKSEFIRSYPRGQKLVYTPRTWQLKVDEINDIGSIGDVVEYLDVENIDLTGFLRRTIRPNGRWSKPLLLTSVLHGGLPSTWVTLDN